MYCWRATDKVAQLDQRSAPLGLEEMKRVRFFKNAYRNVRKAYFDRRTTQSEFCFEINILCDRRSVQCRAMKFEVRKTALQNKPGGGVL